MTGRRYAHSRATVATGGSISDRTPCATYPHVYDALVDVGGTGRSVDPEAVEAARNLCGTCLLNTPGVADKCIRGAIERGEQWVGVMLGRDVRKPPTKRAGCGKPDGASTHSKHRERPCEPCRLASAQKTRDRKRAMKAGAA